MYPQVRGEDAREARQVRGQALRNHGNRPAGEGSGSTTQEASSSDEFVTPVSSHGPSPAATPGGGMQKCQKRPSS
jgi:hypothetical protein